MSNTHEKTPCFYCGPDDRYPACHDTCQKPEYLEYKKRHAEQLKRRSDEAGFRWAKHNKKNFSNKLHDEGTYRGKS